MTAVTISARRNASTNILTTRGLRRTSGFTGGTEDEEDMEIIASLPQNLVVGPVVCWMETDLINTRGFYGNMHFNTALYISALKWYNVPS